MSSSDDGDQGGAGRREVAYRLFAAEYDDADFSYSESDEERAPNYVVTPSGARVNRLFVVGVLTEVEQVNEDVLRARIVDPTGAFVAYAGQYQPDEMAFLDRAEPPTFVALTGKARTFQPDDADTVYTSVRPESINEVDAETRDRWTVATAERTLDRIETMAGALSREERGDDLRDTLVAAGVDEGLAAGTGLALEHYGTTPTYLDALRETALDAARVVAGEIDEVASLTAAPDEQGSVTIADLDGLELAAGAATEPVETAESAEPAEPATSAPTNDETGGVESDEKATPADAEPSTTETEPTATDDPVTESVSGDAGTETPGVETDEEPAEPVGTDAEPATESAEPATESADDIGDFEPSGGVGDADTDDEEVGDFDPGEFELDEDEREEIEEEYGTDFSTGTEVSEPGEAGIETPDPEPVEDGEPADDGAAEPTDETDDTEPVTEAPETAQATETAEPDSGEEPSDADSEAAAEPSDESEVDEVAAPESTNEPAEDVDLEDAVMDAMNDLDDGDGADREALIEHVADRTGADPDAVEEAVQDALMDGRCYEPDEATLKPI